MTRQILIERIADIFINYNRLRAARFSVYCNNVGMILKVPRESITGRHNIHIPHDEDTGLYCPATKEDGQYLLRTHIGTILRRNLGFIELAQNNDKLCTKLKTELQPFMPTSENIANLTPVSKLITVNTKRWPAKKKVPQVVAK